MAAGRLVPAPQDRAPASGQPVPDSAPPTVGQLADLYLGNVLYALERCAMALAGEGDDEGAAYYRGLAQALAEARGRQAPDR